MPTRSRTQAQQDIRDDTAPPWALDLINQVAAISLDQALMSQTLGKESEDGKGGTGLVGSMMAMEQKVDGLLSLKGRGIGLIIGAIIVVAIVVLGIKGAVNAAVSGAGALFTF